MQTLFVWLFHIDLRPRQKFIGPPEGLDSLKTGIDLLYPILSSAGTLVIREHSRTTSWIHQEFRREKIELTAFPISKEHSTDGTSSVP